MIESLYIAESGMTSQQKLIDVISNNIANTSTEGFKKTQLSFVDLVYQPDMSQAAQTDGVSKRLPAGAGVSVDTSMTDFSNGDLKPTGNPFDLAIVGNGFIEVQRDNAETAFTRAGRLRLDSEGYLVSAQGLRLTADIQLPPDASDFVVGSDGSVTAQLDSTGERVQLGQLELVQFNNQGGLSSIGHNLFVATEQSGEQWYARPGEMGAGTLAQGMTEMSNVSMTEEMVNLMLAQRGYQLNARIIQVTDQLLDTINNLRR